MFLKNDRKLEAAAAFYAKIHAPERDQQAPVAQPLLEVCHLTGLDPGNWNMEPRIKPDLTDKNQIHRMHDFFTTDQTDDTELSISNRRR